MREPIQLKIESRHSDYGADAGGYSVLKFNGKWVGRIDYRNNAEELLAAVRDLQAWKDEQLQVESEWEPQDVGRELGVELGASIRRSILPKVQELKAQLKGWMKENGPGGWIDNLRKDKASLLYALKELLYHTEMRGDANKLLAVGKAQKAIEEAEAA
jgi:hypothetical protein